MRPALLAKNNQERKEKIIKTKPFLKWAGGKFKIIDTIKESLPYGKRLVEPFVGSGSVFLNTEYNEYLLNDANKDIINLYKTLKEDGKDFIDFSKSIFIEKNSEETFYENRKLFNETKDIVLKSALFIYLNRHCFNGLCRYNKSGKFNVPYGRYKNINFPENELYHFHEKLKRATLTSNDFQETIKETIVGDIVYCDPPYSPLTQNTNFSDYTSCGFGEEQHKILANLLKELRDRNIYSVISNHKTEFTLDLYSLSNNIKTFEVRRFIASKAKNRKKVTELLASYGVII